MEPLGKLARVELRNIWQSEAAHFTPWLAGEDNLAMLGDTLGIGLELEAVEQNVGPFRADILCKDTLGDRWVLIENQLERTDHTHLGQLITYAAGLDAVTIVWIAAKVADEHRGALRVPVGSGRIGCVAELREQRGQFRCTAVDVTDDVVAGHGCSPLPRAISSTAVSSTARDPRLTPATDTFGRIRGSAPGSKKVRDPGRSWSPPSTATGAGRAPGTARCP